MTEVEIIWPASISSAAALEAEAILRNAGVEATCRLQPVRRGSETVLVLLETAALQPFFGAIFERLGDETWSLLRALVGGLLKRTSGRPAPKSAIFRSAASGGEFVFTTDLPAEAFRKAVEVDPGAGQGRWTWDGDKGRWLCFEDR
jgi:hypothetical protein